MKSRLLQFTPLAVLALASAFLIPSADAAPRLITSYDKALSQSKAQNKPLIVIFGAEWCPPCQMMKKSVYPSTEVAPYSNQFVWAYLDTDDPANRSIANAYRVNSIPHIVFQSRSGKTLKTLKGATSPGEFANVLSRMIKKDR